MKPAGGVVGPEVLRQVKAIELRTRRLVTTLFSGDYRSVFRGQGIEFAEVFLFYLRLRCGGPKQGNQKAAKTNEAYHRHTQGGEVENTRKRDCKVQFVKRKNELRIFSMT